MTQLLQTTLAGHNKLHHDTTTTNNFSILMQLLVPFILQSLCGNNTAAVL